MEKKHYFIIGFLIVIGIVLIVFMRTTATSYTKEKPYSLTPSAIKLNFVEFGSDKITAELSVLDETGNLKPANGTLHIEIIADEGRRVYDINVKLNEDNFAIKTTDSGGRLRYFSLMPAKIVINKNELLKSTKESGKLNAVFTTESGTVLETKMDFNGIPTYTREEIQQMYDKEYYETAKSYAMYQTTNNVKITLIKGGYFKTIKWNWPTPDNLFRIDVSIENLGAEANTVTGNTYMIVDGVQYGLNIDSGEVFGEVYSGATKKAELTTVFSTKIPNDLAGKNAKVIVGEIYLGDSKSKRFEFDIVL